MGHTHYWTHSQAFTDKEWNKVESNIWRILRHAQSEGVALGDPLGKQEINPKNACIGDAISFNGIGDDSHETFTIYKERAPKESWQDSSQHGWDFCKTARKPYDTAVTAILSYLESVYPAKFSVSSDGRRDDWIDGVKLAQAALEDSAYDLHMPVSVKI